MESKEAGKIETWRTDVEVLVSVKVLEEQRRKNEADEVIRISQDSQNIIFRLHILTETRPHT